jgi:hypothetical protein
VHKQQEETNVKTCYEFGNDPLFFVLFLTQNIKEG